MKGKRNLAVLLLAVALLAGVFSLSYAVALQPNGASVDAGTPERSFNNNTSPGENEAQAGNITTLVLTGKTITQSWQGYVGNVTGSIELADATGNVLYNWTGLADPTGEVYASTNATVYWTNIQCFNFTANGTLDGTAETGGGTNLGGMNLTQLQSQYNIGDTDGDAVNNTFTGGNSHVEFFTANQQFSAGECLSTDVYDETGGGVDGTFEEVLLFEPVSSSVVFAALLENDETGFDDGEHDFEMLVLEDGHSGDTSSTTYYFFAEIE